MLESNNYFSLALNSHINTRFLLKIATVSPGSQLVKIKTDKQTKMSTNTENSSRTFHSNHCQKQCQNCT